MLELVDTHCHIQSAGQTTGEKSTRELWAKAPDLGQEHILENARTAGIATMIGVGCDHTDSELAIDCAGQHEAVYASIGIHPHEAQQYVGQKGPLDAFAALVGRPKVVAVGETGLDYFYAHSPKKAQLAILRFQIELALANNLPMIFHVREAFDDFWPVFESYQGIRGVLHSFTDSLDNLERAVGHGLHIGVNGIATFAKSDAQRVMYRTIPQRLLLLETDAPFLTPSPFRGTINEPKQIATIAEFLAQLRGETLESLALATTENAKRLFDI